MSRLSVSEFVEQVSKVRCVHCHIADKPVILETTQQGMNIYRIEQRCLDRCFDDYARWELAHTGDEGGSPHR